MRIWKRRTILRSGLSAIAIFARYLAGFRPLDYLRVVVPLLLLLQVGVYSVSGRERTVEGLVKEALDSGEPEQALRILEKEKYKFPKRAYLDYRYQSYAMTERYDEALRDLAQLKTMEPKNVHWFFRSAYILRLKKQNEKALAELNKVIELKKGIRAADFGYVFYERASLLKSMGRKEEALRDYVKASEQKRGSYEALREGCYLAVELKKPDDAVSFASKLIKVAPEEEGFYLIRAKQYGIQGKRDLALKDLSTALKLSPDQWREIDKLRRQIESKANEF